MERVLLDRTRKPDSIEKKFRDPMCPRCRVRERDGRRTHCIPCKREYDAEWAQKRRDARDVKIRKAARLRLIERCSIRRRDAQWATA